MNKFLKIFNKDEWIHLIILLRRISIMIVVYTILRLLFIIINHDIIGTHTFWEYLIVFQQGFRFDLSAIVYINILFVLLSIIPFSIRYYRVYQKFLMIFYIISNFIFLLFAIGDLVYYRFSLKRITSDFFATTDDFLNQAISYFTGYWYMLVFGVILIYLLVKVYQLNSYRSVKKHNPYIQTLIFFLATGIWIISARGGMQVKPLSPIDAASKVDTKLAPAISNTPFILLYSFTKSRLPSQSFFSRNDCEKIFKIHHQYPYQNPVKKNVVVIILESFSREYSGFLNNNKGYTPFLDSLMMRSLYADNGLANAKHSNEGIPAVIASLPTFMDESYIASSYQNNKLQGLGNILKSLGYKTAFYHAADNGSFNFDKFSRLAGFDKYYGRIEYNNEKDYDGNWGIWDEPYLQYVARKLNEMKQPFGATFFSLTSHYPFTVPDEYKNIFKDEGNDHPLLKCIRYTDYSLKEFFNTASQMPWYNNTLFVICADHTSQATADKYNTSFGTYRIPIVFFDPSNPNLRGKISGPVMQVDILPSIVDYLKINIPFTSFGSSVFDSTNYGKSYQYLNGIYQAEDDSFMIEFNGEKALSIYNYRTDSLLRQNLLNKEFDKKTELEKYLKAVIQSFNNNMNENTLIPPN